MDKMLNSTSQASKNPTHLAIPTNPINLGMASTWWLKQGKQDCHFGSQSTQEGE
jgi:hypothetical protein